MSIFCALCLCLTLLPTAALADGLETGTPTLLNGEGETDYATPSEEDGWTQLLGNGIWFLEAKKTYDQPLRSENPIQIDSNAILTAPSITVDGMVDVSGSASLICSGELSAKELQVSSSVTVGTLSCSQVTVSGIRYHQVELQRHGHRKQKQHTEPAGRNRAGLGQLLRRGNGRDRRYGL